MPTKRNFYTKCRKFKKNFKIVVTFNDKCGIINVYNCNLSHSSYGGALDG